MRSFILASIVALALAATPAFEHNYEPKTEYIYQFDGLILSGLQTSRPTDMSQTKLSTRVRLQAVDDLHIHLQLENIRLASANIVESLEEQHPSLDKRELTEENEEILELPVRAQLRNGLVSNLEFSNEDSQWSKNVKRAVVNMISFVKKQPIDELELNNKEQDFQSFFINEQTIEGDCQVAYTVSRENEKTLITKSINFDKCTSRPQIIYGEQFVEPIQQTESSSPLKPQTVYTYTLEGELLKQVEVRSIYSYAVNGQEVMKTETRSKLIHDKTQEIKNEIKKVQGEKEEIIYSTKWEKSVENFYKNGDDVASYPFKRFTREMKLQMIDEILEKMSTQENVDSESVHLFSRLVQFLRTATFAELKSYHKEKKSSKIFLRALAVAGTKNTIEHVIQHIEEDNEDGTFNKFQLLKSIQETPYPSERIADLLIDLARTQKNFVLCDASWLAAGAVVHGVVSQRVQQNQLVREDTRDVKQKYMRIFWNLYRDAESTSEKVFALKALGNAGIETSVNEITAIINDPREHTAVRKEAVDCLRHLDNVMPLKLQRVLLPIFKNHQNDPVIRMAVLWRLIQTRPSQSVLTQIVAQMEKESFQQVKQFTYNVLRQFSKSTNPQYKQLASDCSALLSFTQYKAPRQVVTSSCISHLPMFAQQLLSGVQIDSTRFISKDSELLDDLQVSLQSLFGENWNRYLAQIGLTGKTRSFDDEYFNIYLRYKNMDYLVLDNEEVKRLYKTKYTGFISSLDETQKLELNDEQFATYFYETERRIPTTLGFAITLSGKLPTVASIKGEVTLKIKHWTIASLFDMMPSVAISHVSELRVLTPLFEQGVKSIQSFTSYTPLKIDVALLMHGDGNITSKITVPKYQQSSLHLSSRPTVFTRFGLSSDADEKTIIADDLKTEEYDKSYKMFGLDFAIRGNVLKNWNARNALLTAQELDFTISNKHKTVEFNQITTMKSFPLLAADLMEKLYKQRPSKFLKQQMDEMKLSVELSSRTTGSEIRSTIEGPENQKLDFVLEGYSLEKLSYFKFFVEKPDYDWTLSHDTILWLPGFVGKIDELDEAEPKMIVKSQWGASNKKNTWEMIVELKQSKEQLKYRQLLEKQKDLSEYERLEKSAQLNNLNIVAEYKFDQWTQHIMNKLDLPIHSYLNQYMYADNQENVDNQIHLKLTVDPITSRFANVTIQTPRKQYQLENAEIPKIHLPTLAERRFEIEQDAVIHRKNMMMRYSSEEHDEEYESEEMENKENNLIRKTEVKEFPHRICFSLEGVAACRRNYDEQETVEQKVKFTCLPRHDSEARRLLRAANKKDVLQLESYPVSFVEPINVPTQCEYAY